MEVLVSSFNVCAKCISPSVFLFFKFVIHIKRGNCWHKKMSQLIYPTLLSIDGRKFISSLGMLRNVCFQIPVFLRVIHMLDPCQIKRHYLTYTHFKNTEFKHNCRHPIL